MTTDEWDQREVCPDGSCIGVIGGDGKCNVCGQVAPEATEPADLEGDSACCGAAAAVPRDSTGEADPAPDPDSADAWQRRQLCSDGGCLGIITDNHRCSVCGKPA